MKFLWNIFKTEKKQKPKTCYRSISLECLEDRAVPASVHFAENNWFYQNLSNTPNLYFKALSLFQQDNYTLQYNDMVKLFKFEATDGATINPNNLTNLRKLITHATQAGWMPDYVANLSNKVVNFNQSNYFYQFQIDPATNQPIQPNLLPTGSLQAGMPSSTLNTLVNKWFLGMDHPDMASVNLKKPNGDLEFSALGASNSTYQTATGVLWGNNGPTFKDMDQGYAGDCYFLSSLSTVVFSKPNQIKNMFINNGNGTYTIRFNIPNANGSRYTSDYVTIDQMFPFEYKNSITTKVGTYPEGWYFEYANGGTAPQGPNPNDFGSYTNLNTGPAKLEQPYQYPYTTNYLWVPLLEKAYAQFNAEIPIQLTPVGANHNLPTGANSYYVIGEGGYSANLINYKTYSISTNGALSEILGTQTTLFTLTPNQGAIPTIPSSEIISFLAKHMAITISSLDTESGKGGKHIVTGHEYYITAYNPLTQEFTVVNPWGYQNTSEGKTGTLQLPYSGSKSTLSLTNDFGYISVGPILGNQPVIFW